MVEHAPRVGLVLGAGGVAGGAFHAGVLAALAETTGWDAREAAVIVGTSAGSVAATSLRAGLSPADMLARAQEQPLSPEGTELMRAVGPVRRPPPLRLATARRPPAQLAATLVRAAARPLAARPAALLAGLLPEGTTSTELISTGIGGLFPDTWPEAPLWVCAVRQSDGRRVVFGADERRPPLADVVAASCAIPGFYRPVTVDGATYIDGGVHSPTNADVLGRSGLGLDLVLVSSPMSRAGRSARFAADQAVRQWSAALLAAESVRLRRRGVPVFAFQPAADDLAVMGPNPMDPRRRAAVAIQARDSTRRRLARADSRSRLAILSS